jgi:hypothetical protein
VLLVLLLLVVVVVVVMLVMLTSSTPLQKASTYTAIQFLKYRRDLRAWF